MNRKSQRLIFVAALAFVCMAVGIVSGATVTQAITYQGKLTDAAGNPLNGQQTVRFSLYEAATGGTALAVRTQSVTCSGGLFTTILSFDSGNFDGRALWLGIKVGTDPEMTPRQEIRPVPYALSLRPGSVTVETGTADAVTFMNIGGGTALNASSPAEHGTGMAIPFVSKYGTGLSMIGNGEQATGIRENLAGRSATGIDLTMSGPYSSGIDVTTGSTQSHGIMSGALGKQSFGIIAYTLGDSSEGIYSATFGRESPGIWAVTKNETSPGIIAATEGVSSTGIMTATTAPDSVGLSARTYGPRSFGVYSVTIGSNSDGVSALTTGDASHGLSVRTQGKESHGVRAMTVNKSSIGVVATTEGQDSPGLRVSTGNTDSYGAIVSTVGRFSPGAWVMTKGWASYGIISQTWGESSHGIVGETHNITSNGVTGYATGEDSRGVSGYSQRFTGVEGSTDSTGSWTSAVYGDNNGEGFGVYGVSKNHYGVMGNTERADGNYGLYTLNNLYVGGKIDAVGVVDPVITERFPAGPATRYETGDLVCIGDAGAAVPCTEAGDTGIIGVVGPDAGVTDGEISVVVMGYRGAEPDTGIMASLKEELSRVEAAGAERTVAAGPGDSAEDAATLRALISRAGGTARTVVRVRADAAYGPILPGDLLTSSPHAGYAMKSQPVDIGGITFHRPGTIVGKAMGSLAGGTGMVDIFVTLQ